MQITEITVTAGRVLPHPEHAYANIRPEVTLRAMLQPGDEPGQAVRALQLQAERLVEDHATVLVASIEQRKIAQHEMDQISRLEQSVQSGQAQLEEIRGRAQARTAQPSPGYLFETTAGDST